MKSPILRLLRARLPALLAALLLNSAASAEVPDGDPVSWLTRMADAASRLDYVGEFVYRHGDAMQTMRIAHSRAGGIERERLVTLDGPPREVIRDGDKVACVLPDRTLVERSGRSALPLLPAGRVEGLKAGYDIAFDGRERVAGLPARKVVVKPRDDFRYGHRFRVAEESGLMLRSEVVDHSGAVIEELLFTTLTIHDTLPAELLRSETETGSAPEMAPAPAVKAGGEWQVAQLPPAFAVVSHSRHGMGGSGQVEHLVLSDGLASVSVFIEHHDGAATPSEAEARAVGAVHAITRTVDGHRLTVVGEVPAQTVEWIAGAVERQRR